MKSYVETIEEIIHDLPESEDLLEIPYILTVALEARVMSGIREFVEDRGNRTEEVSGDGVSGLRAELTIPDMVGGVFHLILAYFTTGVLYERDEEFREKLQSATKKSLHEGDSVQNIEELLVYIDRKSFEFFESEKDLYDQSGEIAGALSEVMASIIAGETNADAANSENLQTSLDASKQIYHMMAGTLVGFFSLARAVDRRRTGGGSKPSGVSSLFFGKDSHYKEQRGR